MIKLYNAEKNHYLRVAIDSGVVSKFKVFELIEDKIGRTIQGRVHYTDYPESLIGDMLLNYALNGYVHQFED